MAEHVVISIDHVETLTSGRVSELERFQSWVQIDSNLCN